MKKTFLIAILFSFGISAYSQTDTTSIIQIERTKYYKNGNQLSLRQLNKIVKPNDQAFKKIRNARIKNIIAGVLFVPGGFMIGYPLGQSVAGAEPDWIVAGIGAGLVLSALPLLISANHNVIKGVNLYNQSLQDKSLKAKYEREFKPHLDIGLTNYGIGVKMRL